MSTEHLYTLHNSKTFTEVVPSTSPCHQPNSKITFMFTLLIFQ